MNIPGLVGWWISCEQRETRGTILDVRVVPKAAATTTEGGNAPHGPADLIDSDAN